MEYLKADVSNLHWLKPRPFPGIPNPIWAKALTVIQEAKLKELVKATVVFQGTTPNEALYAAGGAMATADVKATATQAKRWAIDIRGGLKIAHIHFKDEIYLLNEKQWQAFCQPLMKEFQAKLAKASAVTFDQLSEINQALEILA
jgi:hypothetical protein